MITKGYLEDLRANRGEAYRDYLRRYHPEFDNTPECLIPWPYRPVEAAMPTHCPKCGREVIHHYWSGTGIEYHDVSCAGALSPLVRRVPGLPFIVHHWQITVATNDRPRTGPSIRFDPLSGEPMDGPTR